MRLPLAMLEIFNAIAQAGSMRAAAQTLGIKPSTVSHQLKNLEQQLGTTLFIRTTRAVNLTEAGRALARNTEPAFYLLGDGLHQAKTAGHTATGALKLAVPEFALFLLLQKNLPDFQCEYPEIEIELSVDDAISDILETGFHAGFRLGGVVAQDMVAKPLTPPLETAVVASPKYLATHGIPKTPSDLLAHNCLRYRFHSSGLIAPWSFHGAEGPYPVDVRGNLIANSLPVTLELAKQGRGMAFGFRDYVLEDLNSGDLVEVLQNHVAPVPGIHIYFPREYRTMIPLRLLIEHLQA
ncbi:LysR family transcriptional regulator [Shimia sagamensis]|uniref:Transcriptional regulator, LysR family n=1 Tax=Shimia sagamensis TaxID=1566352 RepID=A0ABY1P9G3_9RHOB|nr:LysR family transcriptional regulator [Shimia sagamensis]SMP28764.1 transcriptional regulator, LysR family [Shimia sagamensis]